MIWRSAALAAVSAGAAGLAFAASPSPLGPPPPSGTRLPEGQCLLTERIGGHSVIDKATLLISDAHGVYRVTMKQGCMSGAISSDPLTLRGDGEICKPSELDVAIHGHICLPDSIVKLSPEQVAALPRALRP
jgi:hypothetical protein